MMAEQRLRNTRRFQNPRSPRKNGQRDPSLFVLSIQLAVCTLLVLLSLAVRDDRLPFSEELSARYLELVSTREISLPTMQAAGEYYAALRDSTADAAAELITGWIAPEEEPPPEADTLTGAGGWMGTPKESGKAAPSSCAFSPILFSAWVEPPVSGKVTSVFGYRAHPITQVEDFHRGIDIAAAQGSGIYTPLPGTVVEIDSSPIYGNYVTLDHGRDLRTTYCHCETIVALLGENLRKGELIATVGSTGISTGPHVHFEINKDGKYYNPAWALAGMNADGI